MRTSIALEQDETGAWKENPRIDVSHDEPLTQEAVNALRELGRLVAEKHLAIDSIGESSSE